MELNLFLEQLHRPDLLNKHPVICFTGINEYPYLFLARCIAKLKEQTDQTVTLIHSDIDNLTLTKSRLQSSFFCSPAFFWLSNIDESSLEKTDFFRFLSCYSGPNTTFIFCNEKIVKSVANSTWCYVALPSSLRKHEVCLLYPLFNQMEIASFIRFVDMLFGHYTQLSLEQTLQFFAYAGLVTVTNYPSFLSNIADKVLPCTQSLFELSQLFLSGNRAHFFTKWLKICDHYPEQFWVSFWSNLCWRAHMFVQCVKQKDQAQAQQLASKQLPFSFIRNDWQRYQNSSIFLTSHSYLFELDSAVKSGRKTHSLDNFFFRFFL